MEIVRTFTWGGQANGSSLALNIYIDKYPGIDPKALDVLGNAVKGSGLSGVYRFVVLDKVIGVHGLSGVVKIIGLANGLGGGIKIRFQTKSENCYSGILNKIADDQASISGSMLLEKITQFTGYKWFNPDRPQNKEPQRKVEATPLVSVAPALEAASAVPDEAVVDDTEADSGAKTKGPKVTGNFELLTIVFEELAKKVNTLGRINTLLLSSTLTNTLDSVGVKVVGRSSGPIIAMFKRENWLVMVQDHYRNKVYQITQAAVTKFGLKLQVPATDSPTDIPAPAASSSSAASKTRKVSTSKSTSTASSMPDGMLAMAENLIVKATEIKAIHAKIKDLMNEIKGHRAEIKRLKTLAKSPEAKALKQMFKRLSQLGKT